jgi:hypothetical protein
MITQSQVQSLFDYRDGVLYWKVSTGNGVKVGDIAGNIHHAGYQVIKVAGKKRQSHRLIFLYHHGYLPKFIDHVDGDRLNNCIKNLRGCTRNQNAHNRKIDSTNTSGIKGVDWHKASSAWRARVALNRETRTVGYFRNKFDAAAAVFSARNRLHGEFARHR